MATEKLTGWGLVIARSHQSFTRRAFMQSHSCEIDVAMPNAVTLVANHRPIVIFRMRLLGIQMGPFERKPKTSGLQF